MESKGEEYDGGEGCDVFRDGVFGKSHHFRVDGGNH